LPLLVLYVQGGLEAVRAVGEDRRFDWSLIDDFFCEEEVGRDGNERVF
jgi:hypothetical protein